MLNIFFFFLDLKLVKYSILHFKTQELVIVSHFAEVTTVLKEVHRA